MEEGELVEFWRSEEQAGMKGWDFSHLDGRWISKAIPWDYKAIVLSYLRTDSSLLDMGTGGGEFLLTLGHPPHLTTVTEAYGPNLELCRRMLAPLGITVVKPGQRDELPLADGSFDLVINRHESFDAHEVHRVLRTGGYFITQQVGGHNNRELSERLIPGFKPEFPGHTLANNIQLLEQAGLRILQSDECAGALRFLDIGALVYYASRIEWEFPGFSVDSSLDALLDCQRDLEAQGDIRGTEERFIIVSKKE